MKKLNLSFLMVCCALMAWADPISKQAALYTAQSYMMAKGKSINAAKKPFRAGSKNISQTEKEAYYYVFNAGNDNGYVIVSGDDRLTPILGYVEQGTFDPDNIPENMRAFLDEYTEQIKYMIDNDLQPNSPSLRRSNRIRVAKHCIPELLTTRWNQGLPYNLTLDLYYKEDGTQARPATGCIATAWAQVVSFHKYPDTIQEEIPGYSKTYKLSDGTEKTVVYDPIPKGTPIDWENMRDTYSCNEEHAHTAQDTAVANLMLYCGHAVKMSYRGSSSAGYQRENFIKYFGFDDSAYQLSSNDYDIDSWCDILYSELEKGYPMPVAGHKNGGGHAFVIDGYGGDDLFHVNWGWGGMGNGYYVLGLLNGWASGQGAMFNLRRPDGVPAYKEQLDISDVDISGTSVKITFKNNGDKSNDFNVAMVMLDENGDTTLVGIKQTIPSIGAGASRLKTFSINGRLPEGTYKLSPASKRVKSDKWKIAYNLCNKYIEAVVDANGKPTMRLVQPVRDVCVDTITFLGNRAVGEKQFIDVTFHTSSEEFRHNVCLFASKTNEKVYTDYMRFVFVRKGETATYSFEFTPEETGTYNFWLCLEKNGKDEIGSGTVEIRTEAEASDDKPNLSITHSIINGTTNSDKKGGTAYTNSLYGRATIKNNSTSDFHGNIKLQLWRQKKSGGSAASSSSQTFRIDIPANKSVTQDYCFENLNIVDYNYYIKSTYVEQSGNLTGGGLWNFKTIMQEGILTWKADGTVAGKAYLANVASTVTATICGFYADCSRQFSRIVPSRNNPNTIYALGADMEIPASIDTCNAVKGNHAKHIKLINDKPYYVPVSFEAESAVFTYTFPDTETGTGWHTFTMPFGADSIFVDGVHVALDDCLKHFWIYEFAAQGNKGEVIFAPATVLRGGTPYIIAGDATMAGRSVEFRSLNASFFKTGSDRMAVTTPDYVFRGCTYSPKLKDCYMLNADGTAFDYVTTSKSLTGLGTYFTTNLSEENRLTSIVLPDLSVLKAGLTDSEDAITPVYSNRKNENVIYDLSGRKVNSQLKKGVYIVNGKKVLK